MPNADRLDALSRPAGGRPTEERELRAQGRRTIRRLLDAGRAAIAERGFPNLRVDDIASRAETSHGTFYLYFANKDDLLEILAREASDALERLADRLPAIDATEAGRTRLREWLDEFDLVYREQGPVLRAWLEGQGEVTGQREDIVTALRTALAERITASGRDGLDPQAAALALVAMIERSTYLRPDDADRDTHLDTLATIAHRGAFA